MNSISNIKTITKRELAAYFSSPVAYVFIVIFLLLTAFFTFHAGGFFERGQATLEDSFFIWHPWLYLFLVPAVGMRLWAEERRVGTLELLLTMPITAWQAIVGKFLASWIFLLLALFLTFPVVITVNYLGSPDNGVILAAYVRQFSHGRGLFGHQLHDLRHDPQPGRQLHSFRRHLPVPGAVRLPARHQFADPTGQLPVAGGYGGGLQRHHPF